jgi:hypothetical protein
MPDTSTATSTATHQTVACGATVDMSRDQRAVAAASPRIAHLDDGQVGLVLISESEVVDVIGCMSADTADAAIKIGLSLAAVGPVKEGVRVVIAVPRDRQLRALSWLTPVAIDPEKSVPTIESALKLDDRFHVETFIVTDTSLATPGDTPTADQLASAVQSAGRDGTSTVLGLASDILEAS